MDRQGPSPVPNRDRSNLIVVFGEAVPKYVDFVIAPPIDPSGSTFEKTIITPNFCRSQKGFKATQLDTGTDTITPKKRKESVREKENVVTPYVSSRRRGQPMRQIGNLPGENNSTSLASNNDRNAQSPLVGHSKWA